MSQLLRLRQRLKSTQSLSQVLSAMQIIAVTKINKARTWQSNSKAYADGVASFFPLVSDELESWAKGNRNQASLLIVISANRGLCGSFNQGVLDAFKRHYASHEKIRVVNIGKKSDDYLRRNSIKAEESYMEGEGEPRIAVAQKISQKLIELFKNGEIGEAHVLSNQFVSMISQKPKLSQLLPFVKPDRQKQVTGNYLLEPDSEELAKNLLATYLQSQIYALWAQSWIGELSARLISLKNAVDNSQDLIESLQLTTNKIRQQLITKELTEVTGAFEALKED